MVLMQLGFGYLRPSKIQRIQINQKHGSLSRVIFTKYITNQICLILSVISMATHYRNNQSKMNFKQTSGKSDQRIVTE